MQLPIQPCHSVIHDMSSTNDLKGKSMIVTGGASEIGLATVVFLLDEEARLIVADFNQNLGSAVVKDLKIPNPEGLVLLFPCDVSYEPDISNWMEFTVSQIGKQASSSRLTLRHKTTRPK